MRAVGKPRVDGPPRLGRNSRRLWDEPLFAGGKQLDVKPSRIGVSKVFAIGRYGVFQDRVLAGVERQAFLR